MTLLELGRPTQARAALERALSIYARHPDKLQEQAEVRFGVATLQWRSGGADERLRARQQMVELREQVSPSVRAAMDAWLEAHPASP